MTPLPVRATGRPNCPRRSGLFLALGFGLSALVLAGCQTAAPVPAAAFPPTGASRPPASLARAATAVIATDAPSELRVTQRGDLTGIGTDREGSFASAVPITPDGYFLTASHAILESPASAVWILYGNGGDILASPARLVWRSSAAGDLALLHAPIKTPHHLQWSPVGAAVPTDTTVFHGGLSLGPDGVPGRVVHGFRPDRPLRRYQLFYHTVPTTFGDSGGPVVDTSGRLLGINTMIKLISPLKTQFYAETTASRPNLRMLEGLIAKDRTRP